MPRRVVVIGAGGVGGWLCHGLAKQLEFGDPGSLMIIVDGDNFEQKNFERQPFFEMGNKAEVRYNELSPWHTQTLMIPMAKWVVSREAYNVNPVSPGEEGEEAVDDRIPVDDLLQEGDIVFCVVDNFAARKVVFAHAATMQNVDVFTGGNDEGLFCSVYHYARRNGENITDPPSEWHPEYDNPPDRNPGELGCAERAALEGGTQLLATNMAVAAMLLGRFQYLVLDDELDEASEVFFDLGLAKLGAFDRRVDAVEAAAIPA